MRRLAAAVAVLCAVVTAPVASAEPPYAFLVIQGSRSAVMEIVVPRATTAPTHALGWRCDEFTTTGSYAAYHMEPVAGGLPQWGGLMLPRWKFGDNPSCYTHMSDDLPLEAGRYRLYLFTDGHTTFRVKLPGYTRNLVARPAKPHRVTAEYAELPGLVSAVPAELKREFRMTRRTYTIQSMYVESALPVGSESIQLCAAPKGQECPRGIRDATWTFAWGPSGSHPTGSKFWVRSTRLHRPYFGDPPGAYDAYWRLSGVDVTRQRSAFWLVTEL